MPIECARPLDRYQTVTIGHGGGGRLTQRLLSETVLPSIENEHLRTLHDGAVIALHGNRLAFTTDSFVVSPPFFPGGDIGSLAVHGTVNDLAMCGAKPLFLSLALILEEGFPIEALARVMESVKSACDGLGVQIATGDTKVVERGKGDQIFINTTGIGEVLPGIDTRPERIRPGDKIIVSGPIAEHGVAILSIREGLAFETDLVSDSAALWPVVERVLELGGAGIHCLRDATRGGVASVLNELAAQAHVGMWLQEEAIPVREPVRGACEMLGLDPLYVANEGRFVAFVDPNVSDHVLEAVQCHPLGEGARIVGEVTQDNSGVVALSLRFGGVRVIDLLSGEQLPRIC